MKRIKKTISIIIAVIMVFSAFTAVPFTANALEVDVGIKYGDYIFSILENSTIQIIDFRGDETDVVIPDEIYGRKVSSLCHDALSHAKNLVSVTIPESVTNIYNNVFKHCSNLTNIYVAKGNKSYSSQDGILFSADFKQLVTYPSGKNETSYSIPESVTTIGNSAFYNCKSLESIFIHDGVTNIRSSAFTGCKNLADIKIPENITDIGVSVFGDTAWFDSLPDGVVYINDIAYAYKGEMPKNTSLTLRDGTKTISANAFSCCENLIRITIPNTVTSIGDSAFSSCMNLTSITIPDSVTIIDDYAFSWNCFTSITIPDSVTHIGEGAFYECANLKDIKISNSVASIDDCTFYECLSLTNVTIPDSVTYIGYEAFYRCSNLTNVKISNKATSIDAYAFGYCSSLKNLVIPDSIKNIGDSAFCCCSSITSITIPENATIGDDAFISCANLAAITIPDSVTNIGINAFESTEWDNNQPDGVVYAGKTAYKYKGEMPENTSITLNEGTKSIATCAFSSRQNLTSVTIPDSITSIGRAAFSNCKNLTSITIPDSVTSIGFSAFSNCTSLASITLPENISDINLYAFDNTAWLENQPDGVVYAGKAVYKYKGEMPEDASITIKEGTKSIISRAFAGCEKFSSITIPSSVTSIGSYAFGYYYIKHSNGSFEYAKNDDLIIYGYKATTAEQYADKEGFTFEFFGDVNRDRTLSILDATAIQKFIASLEGFVPKQLALADFNGDGVVNVSDATAIQRELVNS